MIIGHPLVRAFVIAMDAAGVGESSSLFTTRRSYTNGDHTNDYQDNFQNVYKDDHQRFPFDFADFIQTAFQAHEEAFRLQRMLHARISAKVRRIAELEDEVAALKGEVDGLRGKVLAVRRSAPDRCFTRRQPDALGWVDVQQSNTTKDYGAALRALLDRRPPSSIAAEYLREVPWILSETNRAEPVAEEVTESDRVEENRDGEMPEHQSRSSTWASRHDQTSTIDGSPGVDVGAQAGASSPASRHTPSISSRPDSRNQDMERGGQQKRRTLSDGHSIHGSDRRRAVCLDCWNHNRPCDSDPQCGSCCTSKTRCCYALCWDGLSCRSAGCSLLHPGQWDETETDRYVSATKSNPHHLLTFIF